MLKTCSLIKVSILTFVNLLLSTLFSHENLKPCQSNLTEDSFNSQIRIRVLDTLVRNAKTVDGRAPEVVTFAIPYGRPEWLLRLFLPETGQAVIDLKIATEHIGRANSQKSKEGKRIIYHVIPFPKKIDLIGHRRVLSRKLAKEIIYCFREVIKKTKYSTEAFDHLVIHCDMYSFAATERKFGSMCGQTCSPGSGSFLGEFVALSEAMKNYSISHHPKDLFKIKKITKKILKEI